MIIHHASSNRQWQHKIRNNPIDRIHQTKSHQVEGDSRAFQIQLKESLLKCMYAGCLTVSDIMMNYIK